MAMPEHAKSDEWKGHALRKEHPAYLRRNASERVANTPNDNVLENSCITNEKGSITTSREISFAREGNWQFKD